MPVRTRKLGVNDKDKGALEFSEDHFCRHWVSAVAGNPRNTDPRVAFNQQDNGFEHLQLTEIAPVDAKIIDAPDFVNFGPEEEKKYLNMLSSKLSLAKDYILKEKELSFDPDRIGLHHEPASVNLAAWPIMIDLQSQQLIRLLIDTAAVLYQLNADIPENELDAVLEESMRDYLRYWGKLQASLAWQLPGKDDDERMGKTERIMEEVLEKLVEL
jgi:hypothetical protein